MRSRSIHSIAIFAAGAIALTACGSDNGSSSAPSTPASLSDVVAGEPFPEDRCATNRAAGTITYLTGFDFAATASIVDIIVADAAGYYEALCLDVDITPSFSTANYALVAGNKGQFASGGSFSEVVSYAAANDTEFRVTAVEGPAVIDTLIVKPGVAAELSDLAGTTIGVKGKLQPSIAAMLATAGLTEGDDYKTVPLEGFDPLAHFAIDSIAGFPGYKSNEPGALERAGIEFDLFDPSDYGIPGSFGVIFTSASFADANPTVVEDFMRATMMGLADAIADPEAAVDAAVALINANGNPNFLSVEGEAFRWSTDARMLAELAPDGTGIGVLDLTGLQEELDTYAEFGLFGNDRPRAADHASDVLTRVYDGAGAVIWPG